MAYDPQKIINTANSFLLAADRASEPRPLGPGQFQMLLVPAIVSNAFAIELYFKAIITSESGSAKGHDLSALFKKISATAQAKLVASIPTSLTVFEQKLRDISSVFVDWRYIYEQDSASLDIEFLNKLAQGSKGIAETMTNPTGQTGTVP